MRFLLVLFFFFSSRRRHTRCGRDWSSDVCSSDLRRQARRRCDLHAREPDGRDDEGGEAMTMRTFAMMTSMMLAALGAAGSALAAPEKPARPEKAPRPGRSSVSGIRTVFLPSAANPLVALRIFFQVGAVDDPEGKQGLASLTAEMLGKR